MDIHIILKYVAHYLEKIKLSDKKYMNVYI